MSILHRIQGHDDLVRLSDSERTQLCTEIREFLVSSVSKTGGHLAGNLGAVELTVAIETVFNTAVDRLVFDVGHQSYVHKILTGRQADFAHLRQFGGISGFPKPSESVTDAFVAGHASSSISIALGMARARTLQNQNYNVIALIGDGAATGGMVYEGLNDAAVSHEPMIIILNDNEMSIGKNVGGLSKHLSKVRTSQNYLGAKRRYRQLVKRLPGGLTIYRASSNIKNRIKRLLLPATIFENIGLTYLGPVSGHDLPGLISLLESARDLQEPVLIHVVTQKGCGYVHAENDPAKFHGIGKFDPNTGKKLSASVPTFSDSFGDTLVKLAENNTKVCAITAAMPGGTGLLNFMKRYPERLFDVGIAEEHAVSMAGGLAKQGMIPVVALYSTFLQRAYDQIMQDIAMLHLHVVIAIDRAGLVGDDGPTHHGVFDIGFLRQMPGMLILAPASQKELQDMLIWAVEHYDGPVAVRYPRGSEGRFTDSSWNPEEQSQETGIMQTCQKGSDVTIITYGTLINAALDAASALEKDNIHAAVIRILTPSHLPVDQIVSQMSDNSTVIVFEEAARNSGIRDALMYLIHQKMPHCRVYGLDLGPDFVPHGSQERLYEYCGLDCNSIVKYTKEVLHNESQKETGCAAD